MFFMSTSTIKMLHCRQEESKESSTLLISGRVLLGAVLWGWLIKGRPIHDVDPIRCNPGSWLLSACCILGLAGRRHFDALQIFLAEMHLPAEAAAEY